MTLPSSSARPSGLIPALTLEAIHDTTRSGFGMPITRLFIPRLFPTEEEDVISFHHDIDLLPYTGTVRLPMLYVSYTQQLIIVGSETNSDDRQRHHEHVSPLLNPAGPAPPNGRFPGTALRVSYCATRMVICQGTRQASISLWNAMRPWIARMNHGDPKSFTAARPIA